MTDRYRVIEAKTAGGFIERVIVAHSLTEEEAIETFQQCCSSNSDKSFEIEKYNWFPESNRIGRDPDLH